MRKIVFGIIVVLSGVFLLLNNLGLVEPHIYSQVIRWPSFLMAIGTVFLFGRKSCIWGILLVLTGLAFLLSDIYRVNIGAFALPVLIIFVGIFFVAGTIVVNKKRRQIFGKGKAVFKHRFEDCDSMSFEEKTMGKDGFIKREYAFTNSKERWTYGAVKQLVIEAAFSGLELDLTQMELSDEVETVHIKVTSSFSGVILYVPAEWNILVQKTGTFGSFTDKRRPRSVVQSAKGQAVSLELEAVFGGGEIRCYE
jgi:predicted membrane protein